MSNLYKQQIISEETKITKYYLLYNSEYLIKGTIYHNTKIISKCDPQNYVLY